MGKNLDQYIERIKNLSEKDKMTIASIVIADVMIDRDSTDINSKAEFEHPGSTHTVTVEIDAKLQIKFTKNKK